MKTLRITPLGWCWMACLLLATLLPMMANSGFDYTELAPTHPGMDILGIVLGLLVAAISIFVGWRQSSGPAFGRMVLLIIFFGGLAFFSVDALSQRITQAMAMQADFPPDKTQTQAGHLAIDRAYQTHAHGRHGSDGWYIEAAAGTPSLAITKPDYQFMLLHRAPGDKGTNSDEIASADYFCANVTLQKAGAAIRVVHHGGYPLPAGTVVICPGKIPPVK